MTPMLKGSGRIIRAKDNSLAGFSHPLTAKQQFEIKMQRGDDRMSRMESRQVIISGRVDEIHKKIDSNNQEQNKKLDHLLRLVQETQETCGDFLSKAVVLENHIDIREPLEEPVRVGELSKRVKRAEKVTSPILAIAKFSKDNWLFETVLAAVASFLWAWFKNKIKGGH